MATNIKVIAPSPEAFGLPGELLWVPVDSLGIDPRYQRPVNEKHVAKIAREFDPDLLGVVLVSERDNGLRVLMDGQHRVEALRLLGHSDAAIPCILYRHLSPELEAKIFAESNRGRLSLLPPYVFRARLMSGDPTAHAIRDLTAEFGFHLNYWTPLPDQDPGMGRPEGMIVALGELQKLYGEGGGKERVRVILELARDAWTSDVIGLSGVIMRGISIFVGVWGGVMDRDLLVTAIAQSSPQRLETDAKDERGRKSAAIATVLRKRYNRLAPKAGLLPERNLRHAR